MERRLRARSAPPLRRLFFRPLTIPAAYWRATARKWLLTFSPFLSVSAGSLLLRASCAIPKPMTWAFAMQSSFAYAGGKFRNECKVNESWCQFFFFRLFLWYAFWYFSFVFFFFFVFGVKNERRYHEQTQTQIVAPLFVRSAVFLNVVCPPVCGLCLFIVIFPLVSRASLQSV